jgi:hypothetical protein
MKDGPSTQAGEALQQTNPHDQEINRAAYAAAALAVFARRYGHEFNPAIQRIYGPTTVGSATWEAGLLERRLSQQHVTLDEVLFRYAKAFGEEIGLALSDSASLDECFEQIAIRYEATSNASYKLSNLVKTIMYDAVSLFVCARDLIVQAKCLALDNCCVVDLSSQTEALVTSIAAKAAKKARKRLEATQLDENPAVADGTAGLR